MAAKNTPTENTPTETKAETGDRFKIKVGDTLVFDSGTEIFVFTVQAPAEDSKLGKPRMNVSQRITKADVAELLG